MAKSIPYCSECGSKDVKADAWAEWDENKGEWVLAQTFESTTHCEDCGGECSLSWDEEVTC